MYGSAEEFRDYHESRGRISPGLWDDEYISSALLVATEWLDATYATSFIGYKTGGFPQEREWPRTNAQIYTPNSTFTFQDDEIPERIKQATYEVAWREATSPGALNIDFTPSKYKRVAIEGALSVEYASNFSSSDVQLQIKVIKGILAPLLCSDGNFSSLSGSVSRV